MDSQRQMPGASYAAEGNEENTNIVETLIVNRCKRKRRSKIHPIWDKFKEIQKPLGRIIVCTKCSEELGIRSNTTVLKNHWNSKHKDEPLSSKETSVLSEESRTNDSDTELNSAAEWICKMLPCEQCPRNVTSVSAQECSSILDEILFKLTEEQKQNRDNNSLLASRKKPWVLNCLHMTQNISRGIDPIKYWNGYLSTEWHIIATFALDILSISGSGAPIEAVFSQAEIATTSRRNKTGSELLNAQLIIYCNRDILHQIS
ncbi:hypothetical protein DdX_01118 [Ditylenchus destructor]|uniref:HAT C-terminal dimerisation domain-containing protein n=1 Tax=Ditylenchus destructor TaxID=166010 RepID=A0AAD4NK02_9BILA|nr:hypothetical protein DdX_01118 [Ditylenchus destructor]